MVTTNDQICYYKVISLKYNRNVQFYEKVLDINDADISSKFLQRSIEVTSLSFNQYAGYLVHSSVEINIIDDIVLNCPLPTEVLRFNGFLQCYVEPAYIKKQLDQL